MWRSPGANIRRRDHTGEVWRVELQNKVQGAYTLTVTWDQTRGAQTNLLELTGLSVEGVERETRTLAIAAKGACYRSRRPRRRTS